MSDNPQKEPKRWSDSWERLFDSYKANGGMSQYFPKQPTKKEK